MKKNILFLMTIAGGVVMSSCGKLGDLSADNFKVNPTPLEAIGSEVPATINGVFPEKYLKKKAVVTVTPVLKYEGGEALGQSATFQGEKVEGNGTEINYKVGGTYTMTATEAAGLANTIKPKIAVPTHYASIVGELVDAEEFEHMLNASIKCVKYIK